MKKLLWAILFLLCAIEAFAQVPNLSDVPHRVLAGGDLSTQEAQHRFVDDVVCALNRVDPNFGHLRKNPGQTNVHGHAEDSALYRATGTSVDFIGSSRGTNARVVWIVDDPRYTANDWLPPHNCGTAPAPEPPPTPTPEPVDLSAIHAKLDALANQIAALSLQVAAVSDRAESARVFAESARNRIEDTLTAVDLARQQINRPPLYVGRVFGMTVTLRPSIHPANAIPPQ